MDDILKKKGFVNRTLRLHQVEGVEWLLEHYSEDEQHGCILSDEMGLGKTTQSIAFLALVKEKSRKPNLIVSPLSVLDNWVSELGNFLPGISQIKYHGDSEIRRSLRPSNFDVIITTYEIISKDISYFESFEWNLAVFDEGHRLKNPEGMTNTLLRELRSHFRVILSGTPVQNNLRELYSLLSFVDNVAFPLPDIDDFYDRYSSEDLTDELHDLLKPFLLRRTKNQVLKDLPALEEVIVNCNLTKTQKDVYKACLVKDYEALTSGDNKATLNNVIMQLRKCSNHPYMFTGIEPQPFELGEHLVKSSGKLNVLDKILRYCYEKQHRVLIFSQFSLTLDILQDYMYFRQYSYERLDGSIRAEERFSAIKNFDKGDIFCFLLSTHAGGVGLNLTSADTVVFYDIDWNPQNDIQATARAHRIGQTKPVRVIRLISKHTIDEIMLKRAEQKLQLTKRVIVEGDFSSFDIENEDSKTISDMIVFGLNDLLNDECDGDNSDIKNVLGETDADGRWLLKHSTDDTRNFNLGQEGSDYYEFEGVNYRGAKKEDIKAFEDIIDDAILQKNEELQNRANFTSQDRVQMLQQIKLADEARAKADMERKENQRLQRQKTKEKKWEESGYTSLALPAVDAEDIVESEPDSTCGVQYVQGDVTLPLPQAPNIVLHCCDSNGEWGRGGLFSAITKISKIPSSKYELAKTMGDLKLGQCHLVDFTPGTKIALLISIRRGKSTMKLDLKMLEVCLVALSNHCNNYPGVSVNVPRLGFSVNDWYSTERLLRKYFTSYNIPTLVYYFNRRRSSSVSQAAASPNTSLTSPKRRRTAQGTSTSRTHTLPDCFENLVFYIDCNIKVLEQKVLSRYLIACGGELKDHVDEDITHIVSYNPQHYTVNDTVQIINPSSLSEML